MRQDEARRALADLRQEMIATEKRLAALRKLVEGYTELFPDLLAEDPDSSRQSAPARRMVKLGDSAANAARRDSGAASD